MQILNPKLLPNIKRFRISAKISKARFGKEVDTNRLCRQIALDISTSTSHQWLSNARKYDLEILFNFGTSEVLSGIFINAPCKRNFLNHFGTRSTIAYQMVKMADIEIDSICYDPFCGVSSISLECCSINRNFSFFIGSEGNNFQIEKSKENIQKSNFWNCEVLHFNFSNSFPFINCSVDRIVSDIPHGRRFSLPMEIYENLLRESFRILSRRGKMVFLMTDSLFNQLEAKILQIGFQMLMKMSVSHGLATSSIYLFNKQSNIS